LGLICGVVFVGLEVTYRSVDLFVIGQHWAQQFQASTNSVERNAILQRFAVWNEIVRGWYFPLLLAHLLASCLFAFATLRDSGSGDQWLADRMAVSLGSKRC
jgi:hypothetical protein